jgi:photosystem II stability/assembly factor-like uncharacterized protein
MKILSIFFIIVNLALPKLAKSDWTTTHLQGYSGPVNCIYFINPMTGFVGGIQGKIFKTVDAGVTWLPVNSSLAVDYYAIQFTNTTTGYAVASTGVMKTIDGGNNWVQASGTFGVGNNSLYVFSPSTVITCGDHGDVHKTTNGGSNWTNYSVNYNQAFRGITFSSTGKGFIAVEGTYSLWTSTNSGQNWQSSNPVNSFAGEAIIFNGSIGYLVGSNNSGATVCRSTDDGQTWVEVAQNFQLGAFFSVSFANSSIGYATGYHVGPPDHAFSYKTIDGGLSWNVALEKTGDMFSTWCTFNAVFVGCDSGNVIKSDITIGITPISSSVPKSFTLLQNYPNPFNPVTQIEFSVSKNNSFVKITVFDATGRELEKLVNQELNAGTYKIDFNGDPYSSGIYFYRLETKDFMTTKKMVLLK